MYCCSNTLVGESGRKREVKSNQCVAIHQVKAQNASGSFASIRKEIEMNSVDEKGEERHLVLCVDNLNEFTRKNENLYTLFWCGYHRKDSITAAVLGGENMEFNTHRSTQKQR
jgi:hypothetical protein